MQLIEMKMMYEWCFTNQIVASLLYYTVNWALRKTSLWRTNSKNNWFWPWPAVSSTAFDRGMCTVHWRRVLAKNLGCEYVSFTSQGSRQGGMQLSDGLVQLEQLGRCSPQSLQMGSWGLLLPLLPLLWVSLPPLLENMNTPKKKKNQTQDKADK